MGPAPLERDAVSKWLALLLLFPWTALASEPAPTAALDQATVIVVVGAPGEEEFGKVFAESADRWESACRAAGAKELTIGRKTEAEGADADQLKKALQDEPKEGVAELWLVLIGHGTFDNQEAKFNLRGPDLSATELAALLKPFKRPVAVIDTASASGPFINKLSAPNRVVITATRSGFEVNYTRFGKYLAEAIADPKADLAPYRDFYLGHIWERAQFYDSLARRAVGRPVRHTVLLHHSALNAMFLGDLIAMFAAKGWQPIHAETAFADPVYDRQPMILPAGESLIWAMAKESGKFEGKLRYPGESDEYEKDKLDRLGL